MNKKNNYLFKNRNRKNNFVVNDILYNVDIYIYRLALFF